MSRFRFSHAAILLALAGLSSHVQAADPPSLTSLFPATAGQGQQLEVTAGGTFKDWPVQVHVEGQGLTFEPAEEKGKFTLKVAPDATPGRRLIRLSNEAGASDLQLFTIGTLPEIAEQEPNNEPTRPHLLDTLPAAVYGRLAKRGDVDTFAVELCAGQTLVAALDAQRLGSPMDGVLQLVSPSGFVLDQVDDAPGFDPRLVFHAPSDGTYLVRLFAFPATPDSSINLAGGDNYIYRLTLTTGPYLEQALPLALAACSESTTKLEPVGPNLPSPAPDLKLDTTFRPGYALAWHDNWPGEVELPLLAVPILHEDPCADDKAPKRLPIPSSLSGVLTQSNETDYFSLELTRDQEVEIRVEARDLGSALDPVLRVQDDEGKILAEQDDTRGGRNDRDVSLRFKPKEDGTYRLVLTDLFAQGGPSFVYRLSVAEPKPEFAVRLGADKLTVTSKEPTKLDLTISRENGFDQPVNLELIGLPEGVKATTGLSEPKGDSSKAVTLEITLDPESPPCPFSGPVQVVGRSGDQELKASRETGFDRITLDTLWLTIPPQPKTDEKDDAKNDDKNAEKDK